MFALGIDAAEWSFVRRWIDDGTMPWLGSFLEGATFAETDNVVAYRSEYIWTQLGRQRMQRRIDDLTGHTIVCGYGRMGRRVIEELSSEGHPWVVVDLDPARCAAARAAGGLVVEGDATHDEMLLGAGVARARALITVTRADATNIVITLSARALNPGILIGARAGDADVVSKLYRAGATYVLQHHGTAAMHLALSVTHPVVEEVLNLLIPRQGRVDLGQLVVTARSQLAGHTLASLDTGRYGALVIAIAHGGELAIPPRSDVPLEVGDVLVVAGPAGVIKTLRERTHTVEHRPDELPPAS